MLARNDNQTLAEFESGAPSRPSRAMIDPMALHCYVYLKTEDGFLVQRVAPTPMQIMINGRRFMVGSPLSVAAMPDPTCPPDTSPKKPKVVPLAKKRHGHLAVVN